MQLFATEYLLSQIFWLTIAFLVLLGIIWKYAVPAIVRVLDERAAQIKRDLDAATHQRVEAEEILADYNAKLAQARKEAAEVVSRARAEAEALANERIKQVEVEISRKTEDSHRSIEAAKQQALRDVQHEITLLVMKSAEALIDEKVDVKTAAALTDKALKGRVN